MNIFSKKINNVLGLKKTAYLREGGKIKEILAINSPKQKSLRSAKEHLSTESFLSSSALTEKERERKSFKK